MSPCVPGSNELEVEDVLARRVIWQIVVDAERLLGRSRARAAAVTVMHLEARTSRGWLRGVYRVGGPHLRARSPRLAHVPEGWWSTEPRVRARRLGIDFELDLRDNLQRVLFFTGRYEPAVTRLLRRELRRGDTVVDVGAHIGVHALTAARRLRSLGGGRVIAFEPAPDAAAAIRSAAARQGLDVELVQSAVGADSGTVDLFADPAYDDNDLGVRSQFGKGTQVARAALVSLDEWFGSDAQRVDVVKIDVEGGEPNVLRGMHALLSRAKPRVLIIETKQDNLRRAGADATTIADLLTKHAYIRAAELPVGNTLFRRSDHDVPR